MNALLLRTLRRGTEPLKLRRSDRHARPLPTLGLRGAATSHKGRRAGSRPARATILSCRLSSMAERCVVAAETLDRYRQAVPNIGRVAHRQSGGLQNRVREGSIPSSPANLRAPAAGLSPKTLKVTALWKYLQSSKKPFRPYQGTCSRPARGSPVPRSGWTKVALWSSNAR